MFDSSPLGINEGLSSFKDDELSFDNESSLEFLISAAAFDLSCFIIL